MNGKRGECADRLSRAALRARALLELTRPRIAVLVLLATATGFVLATPDPGGRGRAGALIHVLLGTLLVAGGANTLNQVIETRFDALMRRTSARPIPSGRIGRRTALVFGLLIGLGGVCYLAASSGGLTGTIGAATLASYVLVYTPLKRRTWRSVFVGAVPGAVPPLMGWSAATGTLTWPALSLFALVFIWQLPHFAAIAWLHRDDYGRAGYPLLPVVDPSGRRLMRHMLLHSIILLGASLLPMSAHLAGGTYALGAVLIGALFMAAGAWFARTRTLRAARLHLLCSVTYLPIVLGLMLADRVP